MPEQPSEPVNSVGKDGHEDAETRDECGWRLENTYADGLPSNLFSAASAASFPQPELVIRNDSVAKTLGLDFGQVAPSMLADYFVGRRLLPNSKPIAQAYAGHQFGGFTILGDGRAILLGEQRTPSGGLYDVQLKGAGRTKYSRGGDGLAALGPMLREYIVSEALAGLRIPTTRSLAVTTTGVPVYREMTLPGAVLVRIASSHVRVGTFEFLASQRDVPGMQALCNYVIARHYSAASESENAALALLAAVMERQVKLIASWQHAGFIHGVMNTDNVSIAGESIDFGPCAFMDKYDESTVFSSIDRGGRYAYNQQPGIGLWNLTRFAEALLPLIADDTNLAIEQATSVLRGYDPMFQTVWLDGWRAKLGISGVEEGDQQLIQTLLAWMQATESDFTTTLRKLSDLAWIEKTASQDPAFGDWKTNWLARLERAGVAATDALASMLNVNPAVIPRNYWVEEALTAASEQGDLNPTRRLLEALRDPFVETEANAYLRETPPEPTGPYCTYCGT